MRLSTISAALIFASIGFALGVQGCAEDEHEGACNVEEQEGCEDGLTCRMTGDGGPECVCSAVSQVSGEEAGYCDDGQDCYDAVDEDGEEGPVCACSVDRQSGCDDGQACEKIVDGAADCFTPITVSGQVFDLATGDPVAGAIVVARDANNVAISGLAVTDDEGNYTLAVPTPRDADGNPQANPITLRADAAGFITFPRPPRQAVPIDTAMASGDPPDLRTTATDIALIALQDASNVGTITGTVNAERPRGTVIVAGGSVEEGGGVTGVADFDGTYTVFNV